MRYKKLWFHHWQRKRLSVKPQCQPHLKWHRRINTSCSKRSCPLKPRKMCQGEQIFGQLSHSRSIGPMARLTLPTAYPRPKTENVNGRPISCARVRQSQAVSPELTCGNRTRAWVWPWSSLWSPIAYHPSRSSQTKSWQPGCPFLPIRDFPPDATSVHYRHVTRRGFLFGRESCTCH